MGIIRKMLFPAFLLCTLTWLQLFNHPALGQLPPGMKPFETTKIAEGDSFRFFFHRNIFIVTDDGVISFRFFFHRNIFIVTDDGVIATDPLNPKAAGILMREIKKIPDKPVKYLVYSHNHWDHVLGGKIFQQAGAG